MPTKVKRESILMPNDSVYIIRVGENLKVGQ